MRFRKTVTLVTLVILPIFALSLRAQEKPLTQDQVQGLVRNGLGDETGAQAIAQRGIDFTPGEDFIQSLKAAGANDAFLEALRAAKAPGAAGASKPLRQVQILALLAGGVPPERVAILLKERGIDFDVKDDFIQQVRRSGGDDETIGALKNAKVTKPPVIVNAAATAHEADVREHLARGAELARKAQYADAEQEYRAALLLDPQNADLYVSLTYVLIPQQKWDETESAARAALRLDPNNDLAHNNLGVALGSKGDLDNAIAEFRNALRLNPDFAQAHANLGVALGIKGDVDGAITEYRGALRLNPNYDVAHYNLGVALERKGDRRDALEEYHAAYTLSPNNADYKQHYEHLLKQGNKH